MADAEHAHWAVADVGTASQVGAVVRQHVAANSAQSSCPQQHILCHQTLPAQSQGIVCQLTQSAVALAVMCTAG